MVEETVVSKTSAYTTTIRDSVILCDASSAAFTVTLPTAVGITGKTFIIKKTESSANFITIDGNGSETIDGATTKLIKVISHIKIVSDGSNWQIIEDSRPEFYSVLISNNGTATIANDKYGVMNSPGRSGTGIGSATYTTSFFTNIPNIIGSIHGSADGSTMPALTIGSFTASGFSWITNTDANDTRNYVDSAYTVLIFDRDL